MSRRAWWTLLMLTAPAIAVGLELWSALDGDPDTRPWTHIAVDHLAAPLTMQVVAVLVVWLPAHFVKAYRQRRQRELARTVRHLVEAGYEPEEILARFAGGG